MNLIRVFGCAVALVINLCHTVAGGDLTATCVGKITVYADGVELQGRFAYQTYRQTRWDVTDIYNFRCPAVIAIECEAKAYLQEEPIDGYLFNKDKDCYHGYGRDFLGTRFVDYAHECASICNSNVNCIAFVMDKRFTPHRCFPKYSNCNRNSMTDLGRVDTYLKNVNHFIDSSTVNDPQDCVGFTVDRRETPNVCQVTSKCLGLTLHFHVDLYTKYLYSGSYEPSHYTHHEDMDCAGNDFIGMRPVNNDKQCTDICDETPGCVGFAVDHKFTPNRCFAKNYCNSDDLNMEVRVNTYTREHAAMGFGYNGNIDCLGHDFTHPSTAAIHTPKDCAEICDTTWNCVGFVIDRRYTPNLCFMKYKCQEFNELAGVDTFIREDRPGIIALFNDGETTDAYWKCSRSALANWNTRDYDDSTWDNALALGTNKENPMSRKKIGGINEEANWIWAESRYVPPLTGTTETVYCRKKVSDFSCGGCNAEYRDNIWNDTWDRACYRVGQRQSRVQQHRYTTKCGFWGWRKCTRYRDTTVYYYEQGEAYCCDGFELRVISGHNWCFRIQT